MQLVTVDSSMVHAVGYDEATQELQVVFTSGKTYSYTGVPRSIYDALLAADSKGQFMKAHIIDVYPAQSIKHRRR